MVAGALTFPLIGEDGTGDLGRAARQRSLEHTLLTVLGVRNGWLAVAPVLAAVVAAIALAAAATPRVRIGGLRPAVAALAGLGACSRCSARRSRATRRRRFRRRRAALTLVGAGALAASATRCWLLRYRERRAEPRHRAAWSRPGPRPASGSRRRRGRPDAGA